MVYALAPQDLPASEANRILNAFIGDPALLLAIFHDHFIRQQRPSFGNPSREAETAEEE